MRYRVLLLAVGVSGTLPAQAAIGPPGPRLLLDRAEEVRLARSAAPSSISAAARVWAFENGRYVIADSGQSSVECYVSRSWPLSLEPQCFDAEGAATIMRMDMRGVELAHASVSGDDAKARLAAGLADGTYRIPSRPAMSWMMSAAQVLYSDEGRRVGAWKPHIMLYFPYMTAESQGIGSNSDPHAGIIVNPGLPTANLMVVVPNAVPLPEPPE